MRKGYVHIDAQTKNQRIFYFIIPANCPSTQHNQITMALINKKISMLAASLAAIIALLGINTYVHREDDIEIKWFKSTTINDFILANCPPMNSKSKKYPSITVYTADLNADQFQLISVRRDIFFHYTATFRVGPLPSDFYECSSKDSK